MHWSPCVWGLKRPGLQTSATVFNCFGCNKYRSARCFICGCCSWSDSRINWHVLSRSFSGVSQMSRWSSNHDVSARFRQPKICRRKPSFTGTATASASLTWSPRQKGTRIVCSGSVHGRGANNAASSNGWLTSPCARTRRAIRTWSISPGNSKIYVLTREPPRKVPTDFRAKWNCKDCGKLLRDEPTEAGIKLQQSRAAKQEASSWNSMNQEKVEQDNKDFQDFLMWRRSQRQWEETHQTSVDDVPRRSGLS